MNLITDANKIPAHNTPKVLRNRDGLIMGFKSIDGVEYKIAKKLGEGGFGEVYLVYSDNKKRVIKIGKRPESPDDIRKELRSFKKTHPFQNESDFAPLNQSSRGQYFVSLLPYVEGKDMYHMFYEGNKIPSQWKLRGQPLSHIFYSLACFFSQLQTLHERYKSIHSDIKLENVMTKSYRAYDDDKPSSIVNYLNLIDFGLIKENINLFTVQLRSGTLGQMGPEQRDGRYYFQSDIYSAAEVLGVMLGANRSPDGIDGMNMFSIDVTLSNEIKANKYRGLSKLPYVVMNVFKRMRERHPLNRPTSQELLKICTVLENVFRASEMIKRYDKAIKRGLNGYEAIAYSQQKNYQAIRSMLNDLPDSKLKLEIHRYLIGVEKNLNQFDLDKKSRAIFDEIKSNRRGSSVLDDIAKHVENEFIRQQKAQGTLPKYKKSLNKQVKRMMSLLIKVAEDLEKGQSRKGIFVIEYDMSKKSRSNLVGRPTLVGKKLADEFSAKKQKLEIIKKKLDELVPADIESKKTLLAKIMCEFDDELPIFKYEKLKTYKDFCDQDTPLRSSRGYKDYCNKLNDICAQLGVHVQFNPFKFWEKRSDKVVKNLPKMRKLLSVVPDRLAKLEEKIDAKRNILHDLCPRDLRQLEKKLDKRVKGELKAFKVLHPVTYSASKKARY